MTPEQGITPGTSSPVNAHEDLRWNPYTKEWFCARCGLTSDHVIHEDAQAELAARACQLPSPTKYAS